MFLQEHIVITEVAVRLCHDIYRNHGMVRLNPTQANFGLEWAPTSGFPLKPNPGLSGAPTDRWISCFGMGGPFKPDFGLSRKICSRNLNACLPASNAIKTLGKPTSSPPVAITVVRCCGTEIALERSSRCLIECAGLTGFAFSPMSSCPNMFTCC
jgi:hypothetical protein